jgi:hypothetical protein
VLNIFGTSTNLLTEVTKISLKIECLIDCFFFSLKESFMSEMYLDLKVDGKIDKEKFKEWDPFLDAENEHSLIGVAYVEPKCVLHMIKLEENAKIFDYYSKLSGSLSVIYMMITFFFMKISIKN